MIINYGGISLRVVQTLSFDRQPVLDDSGVDYLFTKFTINVIAYVNSQNSVVSGFADSEGIAYGYNPTTFGTPAPFPIPVPFATPPGIKSYDGTFPSSPVLTDVVVRHWLSRPRFALVIFSEAGQVILQSPNTPGASSDAHNGPFCDVFSIQNVLGQAQTFIVNCQFTTYVNECLEAENVYAALLSNRWTQYHTLDDDYILSVITNGIARFRTDLIYGVMNPDQVRDALMLPIPVGFKRRIDYVQAEADGSAIRYQITDQQTPQQLVVGDEVNATRAEVIYRETINTGADPLGFVLKSIDVGINQNDRYQSRKQSQQKADRKAARKAKAAAKAKDRDDRIKSGDLLGI